MFLDPVFLVALQSSLFLGIIHGINPCGHSWLILAPFVVGHGSGRRALVLTSSFLAGTALACLTIGLTLGAVSMALPPGAAQVVGIITGVIVLVLGCILLIKPELLHHHDHEHDHAHDHDHGHHHHDHNHGHGEEHHHHHDQECGHDHEACGCQGHVRVSPGTASALGLFSIGFMNMIVPCPTVAIMYSYAIDSGSWAKSTTVFGAYALTTALTVGGVIWLLRRAAHMIQKLEKPWIEATVMRVAGALTMAFGAYSIYIDVV